MLQSRGRMKCGSSAEAQARGQQLQRPASRTVLKGGQRRSRLRRRLHQLDAAALREGRAAARLTARSG